MAGHHSVPSHILRDTAGALMQALAVSSTNVYTSEWITIPYAKDVSFHVVFTGTETGTLIVEVTDFADGSNPTAYDLVTIPAISGAMNFVLKLRPGTLKVRLKYTNATNSGTLTVASTVKA